METSENIKFSILIPVYNVESYLEECLESVLAQSYSNWEALLVNDGSTDGSKKICEIYQKRDTRFQLINQSNGGLAVARNTGILNASGDYILFLDSDDVWISKDLLKIIKKRADVDDFDMLQFPYYMFSDDVSRTINGPRNVMGDVHAQSMESILDMDIEIMTNSWTKVIKRELLMDSHLLMDERLRTNQDIDFSFGLFLIVKKVSIISEPLYGYRIRPNSLSCDGEAVFRRNIILDKWENMKYPSDVSEEIVRYIQSKLTYQYLIMLSTIPRVKDIEQRKKLFLACKEKKYLLAFASGKKAKTMAFVCKLLGVKMTSYVFFYINLVRNR